MDKIVSLVKAYPKASAVAGVALVLFMATGFYNYDWSATVALFG